MTGNRITRYGRDDESSTLSVVLDGYRFTVTRADYSRAVQCGHETIAARVTAPDGVRYLDYVLTRHVTEGGRP